MSQYVKQKHKYAQAQQGACQNFLNNRKYTVNFNTCFNCSHEYLTNELTGDHDNLDNFDTRTNKIDFIFDNTKRMTEYTTLMGFTG